MKENIRLGIVGLGNMGRAHRQNILEGKVTGIDLSAVCDVAQGLPEKRDGEAQFTDVGDMISSAKIDAIHICTPHPSHREIGVQALQAGLHVLMEKPLAVHKADCQALIDAYDATGRKKVFAAMFNQRTDPHYKTLKKMIDAGETGKVRRIHWSVTDWFRTEYYYALGGWRATWKGEGGGVLLNQCLHQLDALQWIVGMPTKVQSHVGIGKHHDIEVEDDVTCYMEYPNGASGAFITSTGETPGSNRFEIAGTKGRVLLENDKLIVTRNEVASDEWSRTSKIGFQQPVATVEEIPIPSADDAHAKLVANFVNAILDGEELIAPGASGIGSVELANVMVYSGLLGQAIDLPMDSAAWEAKLNDLIANSTHEKKVVEVSNEDFNASFRK